MLRRWTQASYKALLSLRRPLRQLKADSLFSCLPGRAGRSATTKADDRYYLATPHERFKSGRYEALRQLGTGRYSHVWLVKDLEKRSLAALKILTSDCYGAGHDIFELEILKTVSSRQAELGASGGAHVIGLLDTFELASSSATHHCIIMPVLGCSLHAQARRFPRGRIPVSIMKEITRQLLSGLAFLHENCQIVHTDLSPVNICFEIGGSAAERIAAGESVDDVTLTLSESQPGSIKIIDLGVASWMNKHLSDKIQPEHLRAPEVILRAPWGPPVDIWSLGCLVIQFVNGIVAFPGAASEHGTWSSEDDHLAQYMETLGPMPPELLQRGTKTREYFDDKGNLLRIPTLTPGGLMIAIDGEEEPLRRPADMSQEEVTLYADFLRGALMLDPDHRTTAKQLLQHEWLR